MTCYPRQGVTLARVARIAGVSVPTVSKVLNGRSGVSDRTREQVWGVLRTSGYEIRTRDAATAHLIDVIMPDLDSGWASHFLSCLTREAIKAGVSLVVTITPPGHDWLSGIAARGSGGVIVGLGDLTEAQTSWLASHQVPFVQIDPRHRPAGRTQWITASNPEGAATATRYLLERGHRRIVFAGRLLSRAGRAREVGYLRAMREAGLSQQRVLLRNWSDRHPDLELRRLFAQDDPPTAVLACADHFAIATQLAAQRMGLSVPEDLSIIGFDDLGEAARMVPALTTVRQPIAQMAAAALAVVTQYGPQRDRPRVFDTTLVLRETVATKDFRSADARLLSQIH